MLAAAGGTPTPGQEPDGTTRAVGLGGGFATKGLNAALHALTDLEVTTRIDTTKISPDHVGFGSKVKLRDVQNSQEITYSLVFGDYIDLDSDQISMASPIGSALIGKQLNDEVVVRLPRGDRTYRIVELTTLPQMIGN